MRRITLLMIGIGLNGWLGTTLAEEPSTTDSVVAIVADKKPIQGLEWTSTKIEPKNDQSGGPAYYTANLKGIFRRPGWKLYWGKRPIAQSKDGKFAIVVPQIHKSLTIEIFALGPGGDTESVQIKIAFPSKDAQAPAVQSGGAPAAPAPTIRPPSENLAFAGVDAGFSYFFPLVGYQRRFAEHWAVSLEFQAMRYTQQNMGAFTAGLYADALYFLRAKTYEGPMLLAGFGMFRMALTETPYHEIVYSPAARLTAGWQWKVNDVLEANVSLGGQYLTKSSGELFNIDFSGFLPLLSLHVAYGF